MAAEQQENGGVFNNLRDLEYLRSFPPGYRFAPTDEELIHYYLANKIKNTRLPPNCIVDQNIYRYHPMDLIDMYREYGEREWYFFTPRERKYPNGGRPSRTAAKGFWKATGADKQIIRNDEIIGFRKALVYYTGKVPHGRKTNWIMHEYRVNEDEDAKKARKEGNDKMMLDEWVMCKIYEKNERATVVAAGSPNAAENIQHDAVILGNNIAAPFHNNAAENINQVGVSDNIAEATYHDHGQPQPPLMADDQQHHQDVDLQFLSQVVDNNSMHFHDDFVHDSFLGFDSNMVFEPLPYLCTSSEMQQQPYVQYNIMDDQQQLDESYSYNSFDQNPLPLNVLPPPSSYDPILDLYGHSNSVIETNYSLDDSIERVHVHNTLLLPSVAAEANYSLDDIIDSTVSKRAKVQ